MFEAKKTLFAQGLAVGGGGGGWHDTWLCCSLHLAASPLTAALPWNPFPPDGGAHRPLTTLWPQ